MLVSNEASFETLAEGIKSSDHEAYAALFNRMHQPLLRYIFRITRNEAMCLDVLQDVFMKLWEKRENLEVRISVKALLYTMARNQALNALRSAGRNVNADITDIIDPLDQSPGAEQYMTANELDAYFSSWVKELPPRRAEAFILSRYHGLSHHEISDVMGLSKRTIDTHIVHALRFLKGRLEHVQNRGIRP